MPGATPPDVPVLLDGRRRILVTGGAGFDCCAEAKGYGGAMVRRPLAESAAQVFNLDKMGYASGISRIEALTRAAERHTLLRVDLTDAAATAEAVRQVDPDLVMHLAVESHLDRSIEGPAAYGSTSSPDCAFFDSNVTGTFHLLKGRCAPTGRRCQSNAPMAFVSTTSPPMRCSARVAPRGASRKPPPKNRAAPLRPARPPVITW